MTRGRRPAGNERAVTQEVQEALEHIRHIQRIQAERRAIQRETELLDRKLRRGLKLGACAVPIMGTAGIALILLTDATALGTGILASTAYLAPALWGIHRVNRRMHDARDTDDPDDPPA